MRGRDHLDSLRQNLQSRLISEGRTDLAQRLGKCGKSVTLRCQSCTRARQGFTRCDQKWCPSCQPLLAERTAQRYTAIAENCQWPLMVTWTCQHSTADDHTLLRQVRRSHTKLRRLRWFKGHVRGGVIAYELTNGSNGWHPHAHSLMDCRWLAVTVGAPGRVSADEFRQRAKQACREVADQWSLALGRTGTVEVHRVWRRDDGIAGSVSEVLKYSAKGTDLVECEGCVGAVIDMLILTRNVASWGSFYRHAAVRKRTLPPLMCECGCTSWLPEDVLNAQAVNEYGVRPSKRKH